MNQLKILCVDDDPAILRILGRLLRDTDLHVTTATDVASAQQAILADCPNVVLTDWNMPDGTGGDLCRWIRTESWPHYVYAIVLTAGSAEGGAVQALDSGADDFLTKPIARGELLARLRASSRVLQLERRLVQLAKSDPLTGVPNQRTFMESLEREWSRSVRYRIPLAAVFLDIDYFKRINDSYGHACGDEVIRQIADLLVRSSRRSDFVCRYGGEEFCVLLPETSERHARTWAERVRQSVESLEIQVQDQTLKVTASLGVAERLEDTSTPERFLDLADQALLVAKQSGRNRVICYETIGETQPADAAGPAATFRSRTAEEAMTSLVAPLQTDQPARSVAAYLLRFRISSAPVVNSEGKLVGIISEKDLMAAMLTTDWQALTVGDLMKKNVVCYDRRTPVISIYEFLCRVSIRSVIIVDGGHPVGVISRASLLRWYVNLITASGSAGDGELIELGDNDHCLNSLRAVATELIAQARCLESAVENGKGGLVANVVGTATRLQELANDLLSHTRHLHRREFVSGCEAPGL